MRTLKLVLLSRQGRESEALKLAKGYLQEGTYDADLLHTAYLLGTQSRGRRAGYPKPGAAAKTLSWCEMTGARTA